MKIFLLIGLLCLVLSSCASIPSYSRIDCDDDQLACRESATVEKLPVTVELKNVPGPSNDKRGSCSLWICR